MSTKKLPINVGSAPSKLPGGVKGRKIFGIKIGIKIEDILKIFKRKRR